jgi:hypothetical protein
VSGDRRRSISYEIVVIGGADLIGSKNVATQDRKAFEPNAGRIQTPTDERNEQLLQDGDRHRLHSNLPAADFCQRGLQL